MTSKQAEEESKRPSACFYFSRLTAFYLYIFLWYNLDVLFVALLKQVKNTKKHLRIFLFLFIFISAFFLVQGGTVHAEDEPVRQPASIDGFVEEGKTLPAKALGGLMTILDETVSSAIQGILYFVLVLVGWLVTIGATILEWVLTPLLWGSGGFLEKPIIYNTWQIFRDLFNMLFILMLLFSAFATIFQVSKYNFKSIWLSILMAALLINFSYPISRVIIDISNVMMFSFLDGSSGLDLATDFMSGTKIEKTLMPLGYSAYPIPYIIGSIIFVFITGVTLIILGVLMMIRLIALMALVILSPVGFAGAAFPGLGGYASKWWDALIKYSFFGPIMVFTLMLATSIMGSIGDEAASQLVDAARANTPAGQAMGENLAEWFGHAAYFMFPIMIIWGGMGIAQSMSIAGAGAVVGKGKQFSKWAGNLPVRGGKAVWKGTGVPGGVKQMTDKFHKTGKLFGRKVPLYGGSEETARRESLIGGALTDKKPMDGWRNAQNEHDRKKINEIRKEWKELGVTDKDLQDSLHGSDAVMQKAALMEMAENKGFGATARDRRDNYAKAVQVSAKDPVLSKQLDDKVKEKNIGLKINYEISEEARTTGAPVSTTRQKAIFDTQLKGLSPEKLANQKNLTDDAVFKQYMRAKHASDPNYVAEYAKKLTSSDRTNLRGHIPI